MIYKCEFCGKDDFKTEKECKEHEERHILEEKLKELPEGATICPLCNGKGYICGEDGIYDKRCTTCHGEKFVKPIPVIMNIPISQFK